MGQNSEKGPKKILQIVSGRFYWYPTSLSLYLAKYFKKYLHYSITIWLMDIKEMVDELFDVFDVNNDGVISRGEFVSLAKSLLDEQELQFSSDIFKEFDANHDNAISKDELVAMIIELAL